MSSSSSISCSVWRGSGNPARRILSDGPDTVQSIKHVTRLRSKPVMDADPVVVRAPSMTSCHVRTPTTLLPHLKSSPSKLSYTIVEYKNILNREIFLLPCRGSLTSFPKDHRQFSFAERRGGVFLTDERKEPEKSRAYFVGSPTQGGSRLCEKRANRFPITQARCPTTSMRGTKTGPG